MLTQGNALCKDKTMIMSPVAGGTAPGIVNPVYSTPATGFSFFSGKARDARMLITSVAAMI